jgi:hypothetical protein
MFFHRPEHDDDDQELKRKLAEIVANENVIISEADLILQLAHKILDRLNQQTGFTISQLKGTNIMPITGIVAGATGVFQETPTPPGAVIPVGTIPQWSTSDTVNTALTPSADGTQCAVAVAATATISTFNLSVANQDGSFLTTVAVPVLPAPPPPPPAQTGFQIDQLS